jgi:hypothetical protein
MGLGSGHTGPTANDHDLNSNNINSGNHKCRLLHQGDPYTKLGPFKMEVREGSMADLLEF